MNATSKWRERVERALIALDACEALHIELPGERRPEEFDERIVWGALLQVANPHVALPSPSTVKREADTLKTQCPSCKCLGYGPRCLLCGTEMPLSAEHGDA